MKDLFLGRLLVLSVVILLSELSRLERVHEPTEECAKQNGGGEVTQFRGFPEASRSFIYITTAKEIGNVYNDITCSRAAEISLTLQSVTYVSVPFLGPYSKAPSWCRRLGYVTIDHRLTNLLFLLWSSFFYPFVPFVLHQLCLLHQVLSLVFLSTNRNIPI